MKKLLIIFLIVTGVIFIVMTASYMITTASIKVLDKNVRQKLSGKFIQLSSGTICYQYHGRERGELIVMVHGFSTPKVVFTKNVGQLTAAGYRVLTFDHFGRGYSDRPMVHYDKDFFDRELVEFFDKLNIDKPFTIIGYSLGGGVSAVFAARHPERIKRIILIAPVGFMPPEKGINSLLLVPVLGKWLMAVAGKKIMISRFRKEYQGGMATKEMFEIFKEQFNYAGYMDALISTMKYYPMNNLLKEYNRLGMLNKPTLVIWGRDDKTVPYEGAKKVMKALAEARLVTIKGGKHSIAYSHSKIVNRSIINFLRR